MCIRDSSRAIPEIDGFKPSHRKLLFTMYKMGLLGSARTKSANIVGQTMKPVSYTHLQAARGILDDATSGEREVSLLLDSAERRIYDIRQGKSDKGLQPVREILLETFDRLDKLNSADREKYQGLPTGIKELDSTITGLNRSDLRCV